MKQYKSLNDAAERPGLEVLRPGTTQIWYRLNSRFQCDQVFEPGITHALIGAIEGTDKESIYWAMQGEEWSPDGEANDLIEASGTQHTSMSVGDVILIEGVAWMVAFTGFEGCLGGTRA